MKKKIIKASLLLIGMLLIIFGISRIVKYQVVAVQGKLAQTNASNVTSPTLSAGEKDPNRYSYHTHTGTWEALNHTGDPAYVATYGSFQIYCINPGAPIKYSYDMRYADALDLVGDEYTSRCGCARTPYQGKVTPPVFKEAGTYSLPPAAAYIISTSGSWTLDKQRAIWNLRGETIYNGSNNTYVAADGGMIIGSADSHSSGPSSLDKPAQDYAEYHYLVAGKGLQPVDATGNVTAKIDQNAGKYILGPLKVDYTNGIYGNIAFGGISEIKVIGFNSKGEKIKDNIKVEKIITNRLGEVTPEYFEPSADLKIDTTKQVYPEPGESFQVVFSNPNKDVDNYATEAEREANTVVAVSIKVKFKWMLANGKYTKLRGTKYTVAYSHSHDYDHEHTCHHYTTDSEGKRHHSGCHTYDHYSCETTCYLSSTQQQWLMAADAIRSVYEQELEFGVKFDITMEIGGNVWEDLKGGKETLADGKQGSEEPAVVGIPVILYTKNGTKIATTKTDSAGEYKFKGLDAMGKYYVEFQYNGQEYENTIYENNLAGGYSNATESTKDRDNFNNKFAEVDGDEGYKIDNLETYLPDKPFSISAYTGSNGKESVLQVYPKYDKFVVSETDEVINGTKYEATYEKGDSQKEVDFGITKRIQFDMAVKKDVYAATVRINGKTEVYGYDKRNLGNNDGTDGDTWNIEVVGGYNRGLDNADYNFTGQNGNNQLLEVYVTYKVAVRNQSQSMLGHVTKLYDYYDSTYEYIPELSWQSNTNYRTDSKTLDNLQDSIEQAIENNQNIKKSWGTEPNATDRQGKLTIDVNKKQQTGETVYIYLTFKVNGEGPNLSLGEKANKVEVGAFRTYYKAGTVLPHYGSNNYVIPNDNVIAGRVDKDSIPSSMGAKGQPKEDDEDNAPGINVHLTGETRKLNGTVWEDKRTEKSRESYIGNGLKENGEIGIAGVKVQLVEKTVKGTEYVWKTTTTDSNGKYNFNGYIAGDYVVRFFYGDSMDTVATKANGGKNDVSYNGQDFKSTTYQNGVTQNKYTDLDKVYTGYSNVDKQNETGTYGYDIEASEGKNVSDAKDIWSRRAVVNSYSTNNVTNGIAEILASPYEIPTYNGKEYTKTEMNVLMQELINNTYMTAETGVIVVEVEKNTQSNLENGKPSYSLLDIDLGLTERPKAQLEIDKSITNVKVTLANNSVLFDVNKAGDNVIWKEHEEYNLASKKNKNGTYEEYYGKNNLNRYSYRTEVDKLVKKTDKGLIQLTMDEELMHGATIQITYKVKVTNVGEVDYVGQKFYYLGDSTGANQVMTVANQVVDYVANNLQFDANNTANQGWSIINTETLKSQGLVNNRLSDELAKFNKIIQTEELNKSLKPGESTEKTLVLNQLISTENTSDDLTYSNMVEIVKTSNTAGRRMAYSVVGNQNPTASTASEVDSSVAEKVIILPPFGDIHIFYILGAVIGIILIGGIAIIIRKVLKK